MMEEQRELIIKNLNEGLESHNDSRKFAQNKLHEICDGMRKQIDDLERCINKKMEDIFNDEDENIQTILDNLRESTSTDDISNAIQLAKKKLLVAQSYNIVECNNEEKEGDDDEHNDENDNEPVKKKMKNEKSVLDLTKAYKLKTERKVTSLKWIGFEERKPTKLMTSFTEKEDFLLSFSFFNDNEIESLHSVYLPLKAIIKIYNNNNIDEENVITITKEFTIGDKQQQQQLYFNNQIFSLNTTYNLKVRIEYQDLQTQWSDNIEFTTPEFKLFCNWKKCPDDVEDLWKYIIDENNPRTATKLIDEDYEDRGDYQYVNCGYSTIIGDTYLPPNRMSSWSIKILKSKNNDGHGIYIGVAPFDINQYEDNNYGKCGWYINCYSTGLFSGGFSSTLCSGPPHNYQWNAYGPEKEKDKDVHTGDSIGVVMDTAKGELSFIIKRVNFGVAYEGIPLDKPLVPCVLLKDEGDTIEYDSSRAKESMDGSIPIPTNIITESKTWNSITVTWDAVEDASFYQIEVDGNIYGEASTTNTLTKIRLLEETEYTFRVRAVKDNFVGKWSEIVKGKTQKNTFETSGWKECPEYVGEYMEYSVNTNNTRIVKKIGCGNCYDLLYSTIIGNTSIPLNKVTSWNIKILKSDGNNGDGIYIGVAPFDINQDEGHNEDKCGWYFGCYSSTLYSGPPHDYKQKRYGPRKGKGKYVHEGDSVGVVMDTAKGDLSFALKGENHGIAYEGIPLDKPLVPCALIFWPGVSVELII